MHAPSDAAAELLRRRLARRGTRMVVPDRAKEAGEPNACPASSENH